MLLLPLGGEKLCNTIQIIGKENDTNDYDGTFNFIGGANNANLQFVDRFEFNILLHSTGQ